MTANPSTWVVDASVAFAWFVDVPGSERAAQLLTPETPIILLAPDLILAELLNAGWKTFRVGAITAKQFDALVHRAAEPFSQIVASSTLTRRARHWCTELDHCAYDCLYVALAEQMNATLITADQRLLNKLNQYRAGKPSSLDLAALPG